MTNSTIGTLLTELKNTRGQNRINLIENISNKFISDLKDMDKLSFTKDYLNVLFDEKTNDRTRERVNKAIIEFLKKANKIKEIVSYKTYYSFVNKPLSSYDFGSYRLLMKYNKNKPRNKQGCFSNGNKSVIRTAYRYPITSYELI